MVITHGEAHIGYTLAGAVSMATVCPMCATATGSANVARGLLHQSTTPASAWVGWCMTSLPTTPGPQSRRATVVSVRTR